MTHFSEEYCKGAILKEIAKEIVSVSRESKVKQELNLPEKNVFEKVSGKSSIDSLILI
jgi:hypothetical protein